MGGGVEWRAACAGSRKWADRLRDFWGAVPKRARFRRGAELGEEQYAI